MLAGAQSDIFGFCEVCKCATYFGLLTLHNCLNHNVYLGGVLAKERLKQLKVVPLYPLLILYTNGNLVTREADPFNLGHLDLQCKRLTHF